MGKIWLLETLKDWLTETLELNNTLCEILVFIIASTAIITIGWGVYKILHIVILKIAIPKLKGIKIVELISRTKFLKQICIIIPIITIIVIDQYFFAGFNPYVQKITHKIIAILITVQIIKILCSLLDAWVLGYLDSPRTGQKTIKGYTQIAKIILWLACIILVIAIILDKDPSTLLVGLGAMAAVISFVFKDTILGFIASIQLSTNNMVQLGDWIEMPSKNADGTVLDINVNSIKVQNWDNTITMVPIYSLVSEGFTNWRGMEESGGRRFVRTFQFDILSIQILSKQTIEKLKKNEITAQNFDSYYKTATQNESTITNMALYRAFLEEYLRKHPATNENLPLYVRYVGKQKDDGLGVELYAFSKHKSAAKFDIVHRSVVEYILATCQIFDLKLYQFNNKA